MLIKLSNNNFISTSKIRALQKWIEFRHDRDHRNAAPPNEVVIGTVVMYENGTQINVETLTPPEVYEEIKDDL